MADGVATSKSEVVTLAIRRNQVQAPDTTTSTTPDSDDITNESSPHDSALPRQKRWAPRVRTGCLTCRKRRVKCDETKPVCMRCVKVGRECINLPDHATAMLGPRSSASPVPLNPTRMEQTLRHYFLTEALMGVADEFNWELWHYYLPQASQSFQPIWHASNAVAAVTWSTDHRVKLSPDVAESLEHESARQYSSSMKQVLALTHRSCHSAQDKATVLLASILYSIYVGRRGDIEALHKIRDMNQRLVLHWKFWECTESSPAAPLATQVLYHFVKGTAGFHETLFHGPKTSPGAWLGAIRWFQKRPLATLMHAQIEAELLWTSICEMMRSMPFHATALEVEVVESKRALLQRHLTLWEERCIDLASALTSTSNFQISLLQIQRILIHIYFNLDLKRFTGLWDETGWDEFEVEFATVVDMLETLLLHQESSGMWPHPSVSYAGQAFRLLEVVTKACRAPRLRRRAAVLLKYTFYTQREEPPTTEEDWADISQWFVTSHVIRLEEIAWRDEAARFDCDYKRECVEDEFVCNLHRVTKIMAGPKFGPRSEEYHTLITVGDILNGRSGTKECIDYGV
ncbi:hypothetical protein PWT90_01334 [Aphanocladium album]|nr:hypothetical protein PWT90_01334 [Aphanocladium album]